MNKGTLGIPSPDRDTFTSRLLHIRDERASGTAGGTATSGSWLTRTIQTVKTNEIPGSSLLSNVISLPPGKYWGEITSAFHSNMTGNQSRLYNTSLGAMVLLSNNGYATTSGFVSSTASGRFTLSSYALLELQYRVALTRSTDGLGNALSWGTEVYADVRIWQIRGMR